MLPEQQRKAADCFRREVKLLSPCLGCYFWNQKDAALSLIVPRTRLRPRHPMLPRLPPAPHLLQAGTREHFTKRGRARGGHIIPRKHDSATQSGVPLAGTQHCQDTEPKHTMSYPLPPLPWQTWGAHPPWDSRISLRGEEKRQRRCLLHGCRML